MVSHSKRELDREGLDISKSPKIRTYEWINKKTGEIFDIPEGIDPGWAYNPGKDYPLYDVPKLGKVIPGQKTWRDWGRPDLRSVPESARIRAPELMRAAASRKDAEHILAEGIGIPEGKDYLVIDTVDGDKVIAHRKRLGHLVEKTKDARERYAKYIIPTLREPFEVWLTEFENGFAKEYIGLFTGKENLMVSIRLQKDGSFLWNVMQARDKDMNKHRLGVLLWGK